MRAESLTFSVEVRLASVLPPSPNPPFRVMVPPEMPRVVDAAPPTRRRSLETVMVPPVIFISPPLKSARPTVAESPSWIVRIFV